MVTADEEEVGLARQMEGDNAKPARLTGRATPGMVQQHNLTQFRQQ